MSRLPADDSALRELIQRVLDAITTPTRRDRQVKIGPSGLGDPCDFCIGQTMALSLPGAPVPISDGNLAAWIGTSIHEKLERTLSGPGWAGDFKEITDLPCGHIEGYGDIKGTADFFSPEAQAILHWKSTTTKKIKSYQVNGIPSVYNFQRNLYALGVRNLGYKVRWTVNVFIPRDEWQFKGIWWDIQPVRFDLAESALTRAQIIWTDFVSQGRTDELGSDDDCFKCNVSEFFTASKDVRLRFHGEN